MAEDKLLSLLGAQHRWADAWKAIDRLNTLRPDWPPARYAIGRMAAESGERLDQGEAALRGYLEQRGRRLTIQPVPRPVRRVIEYCCAEFLCHA